MNQNRIKLDGFSNPDTEQYFWDNWTDERHYKEIQEEKSCVFCCWSGFLAHDGTVVALCTLATPGGNLLISAGEDGRIIAWSNALGGNDTVCLVGDEAVSGRSTTGRLGFVA